AGASWAVEARLPEDELWRLRPHFDRIFIDYLEYRRETKSLTADDRFVQLYFDFLKFLNALVLHDDAFSHFLERVDGGARFRILCKDPSRFLGAVINRCHSVIGLSATLSPPDFYRDLLGFDAARTHCFASSNPFPAENRRVVIDTQVATTFRERPIYYPVIAERLAGFADAVPGNCLALFPSYQFLAEISGRMRRGANACWCNKRATAIANAKRSSTPCAPHFWATCCCSRWRAAFSPKVSIIPATCSRRWRWWDRVYRR
ncbi:MAG: hypothetical protein HC897_20550, partial [Thermoanaerobaculia bacterium]|nr:hypothetical protein [Thermoanaerobaculia bacterium]